MKCHLVRDLLPVYIDGVASEETSAELQAHLTQCADCNALHEKMTADIPSDNNGEEKEIDFLKGLKRRMKKKSVRAALFTGLGIIAFLTILTVVMTVPEITIPFDADKMWVEVGHLAYTEFITEEGWHGRHWRLLYPGDALRDGEQMQEELMLRTAGFSHRYIHIYGRTIYRGGERVRIVFYSYTESPLQRFLRTALNWDDGADGRTWHFEMHGMYIGTQQIEVYYLPGLHRLLEEEPGYFPTMPLSNDEFYALLNDAVKVWYGTMSRDGW